MKAMNERFDEEFNFADIFEDSRRYCNSVQNDVKSFIQSEIELAKKEERERIKELVLSNMISNKNGEYIDISTFLSVLTNNNEK